MDDHFVVYVKHAPWSPIGELHGDLFAAERRAEVISRRSHFTSEGSPYAVKADLRYGIVDEDRSVTAQVWYR